MKVDAPNGDPHAFVERFVAQSHFDDARLSTLDGLRVDWPDGWGLVRASNTTPVLVLRFAGDSDEALARIQQALRGRLMGQAPETQLPFIGDRMRRGGGSERSDQTNAGGGRTD